MVKQDNKENSPLESTIHESTNYTEIDPKRRRMIKKMGRFEFYIYIYII